MTILSARSMLPAVAVLAAVLGGGCSPTPPSSPAPHSAAATAMTTVDTGISTVLGAPCDAVPPALTPPGTVAAADDSPGALPGRPPQPSCGIWTPGDPLTRAVVLYRDYAPMTPLRDLQPTARTLRLADLDTVEFPVPTTTPATGTTCVIVADLGPLHGVGVVAQNAGPSDLAATCTSARDALHAVITHLRALAP